MTEQTFVEQVDDLARLMGLDVAELHELHKAVSRRVTRMRIPELDRSVAEAMDKYVPWYRLSEISLADAGREGAYLFLLSGTYYPNAHKGDFSVSEERLARIVLSGRGGIA